MKTKKIISALTAVIMLFAVMATAGYAASDTTVDFSLANQTVSFGDTISVPLKVVTSTNTEAVGCYVNYDPAVLTYDDFTNNYGFSNNDISIEDNGTGRITVKVISAKPAYNNVLFTFNFTAISDTDTELTVAYLKNSCGDGELEIIPQENQTFTGSSVTFITVSTAPEISIGAVPASVSAGGKIVISYSYSDPQGIADATTATAAYADTADASDWTAIAASAVTVADGKVTVDVDSALIGKYITVTINPKNAEGEEGTSVTTSAVEVTDKPVITVSSENVTISQDEDTTVDVTVSIEGSTGFTNLGLEIDYDDSVMTLTNAVAEDIDDGTTFIGAGEVSVKPYMLTWNSADDVVYNGTLVTLTFTVSGAAEAGDYEITVDFYKGQDDSYTDGEDVNYSTTYAPLSPVYLPGTITVAKIYPGDITGDNRTNSQDAIELMKYIAKWDVTVNEDALDTNGDTKINSKDVTHLLRWLAAWDGIELHYGR